MQLQLSVRKGRIEIKRFHPVSALEILLYLTCMRVSFYEKNASPGETSGFRIAAAPSPAGLHGFIPL